MECVEKSNKIYGCYKYKWRKKQTNLYVKMISFVSSLYITKGKCSKMNEHTHTPRTENGQTKCKTKIKMHLNNDNKRNQTYVKMCLCQYLPTLKLFDLFVCLMNALFSFHSINCWQVCVWIYALLS